jgi:predicted metal-dependent hydrolase
MDDPYPSEEPNLNTGTPWSPWDDQDIRWWLDHNSSIGQRDRVRRSPSVELKHSRIFLRLRPETPGNKEQAVVEAWYREQIRKAVPSLIAKWEPVIGVKVEKFFVQKMKTKWRSCNSASNIRPSA